VANSCLAALASFSAQVYQLSGGSLVLAAFARAKGPLDLSRTPRSPLHKNLSPAVTFFALGHGLVIDRLAVTDRFDLNPIRWNTRPDQGLGNGIGARL